MDILEQSLKSKLPFIHVTTSDLLYISEVLSFISGETVYPLQQNEDGSIGSLKHNIYYTSAEIANPATYFEFKSKGKCLVFVNTKPSVLHFNGGVMLPPRDMMLNFLRDLMEDAENAEAALPAFSGMTLKEMYEATRLTLHRAGKVTSRDINDTRRGYVTKLKGLVQVDTKYDFYQCPSYLEEWLDTNSMFFITPVLPSLTPRGLLLDGAPGTGKCLDPKEPVLMFDGSIKKTGALLVGDLLMGPDSTPRKVLSTNTGFGPMYEIRPVKGKIWKCNGDHILSLRKSRNPDKGSIKFVTVDEWVGWADSEKTDWKLWRASVDFPERNNPSIDPYFMGVVLGDGGVSDTVKVTTMDTEIVGVLESIAKDYGLKLRKDVCKNNKADTYALSAGNSQTKGIQGGKGRNKLLTQFQEYGLVVKCDTKFIPDDYKLGSRETRLQVLAGLMDTDGNYYIKGNGFDYISKSPKLVDDIAFIARSLGMAAYSSPCYKTCGNNGVVGLYYRISISGNIDEIPTKLLRKKAKKRKINKDVTNTGFDIFYAGLGDWFGITLDGDHQYLLDDFTVTHNTAAAKFIASKWDIPLYHLDIGSLKDKYVGGSEAGLNAALSQVDSLSNCVLLLDEAEKAFSSQSDSGVTSSLLGTLLWWLQEHESKVFTVMTTNCKESIPKELYREGRIDAVMVFRGLESINEAKDFAKHVYDNLSMKLWGEVKAIPVHNKQTLNDRLQVLFSGGSAVPQVTIVKEVQAMFKAIVKGKA